MRVSIRISSGPSDRKLNPLCASSNCRLLTPKSASNPSRLPFSITPAASETGRGSKMTSGISLPISALISSIRAFANSIASGSRSKQISLPFATSLFAICEACPPSPTVASTITPPGRTLRYCKTSSKRTGTCCGLFMRCPWGPSVHPSILQRLRLLRQRRPARARHLYKSIRTHTLRLEHFEVGHLENRLHPQHVYIACQLRRLPNHLRQKQPALRVHLNRSEEHTSELQSR